MANQYAVTAQIASVKRRGWVPTSTALTTADFLGLFNEESRGYITALLKSGREEYLVNEADTDVAYAAGAAVPVPTRCVASALRSVHKVDSAGTMVPLTRVEPEKRHLYPGSGDPLGYMLRGNLLQLLPSPSAAGTLRLGYLQRPGKLVEEASCGTITAINTTTKAVTVAGPTLATFTSSTPFDLVQGVPPFDALGIDLSATKGGTGPSTGLIYTFALTLPTRLAVGDFICLAGETAIPQLPLECHPLLAQRVVVQLLSAQGGPRFDAALAILEGQDGKGGMRADTLRMLTPRVTASSRRIVSSTGPGMRRTR